MWSLVFAALHEASSSCLVDKCYFLSLLGLTLPFQHDRFFKCKARVYQVNSNRAAIALIAQSSHAQ